MRLYFYGLIMLIKKFIFRQNTGKVILWFSSKMGVVYIKLAQLLAMQNYGELFTEEDRIQLSKICDNCNPIKFKKIKKIIEKEYKTKIEDKFLKVYEEPIGSASISQVHKAILKNGDVVVLKIKRKDITKRIDKDIKQIKKIVKRFGRFVGFKNVLGSNRALDLYISWICEEIDFENEKNNIRTYQKFADSVNKKVDDTNNIVTPKLYNKFCTENIIVMEYIKYKTINQIKLNKYNKRRISKALNDYCKLSFYALLNGKKIVFHGDPHGGNIYIDDKGNIGFLDMGLIFDFNEEEAKFVRDLFLSSYNMDIKHLIDILLGQSIYEEINRSVFDEEIENCCKTFKNIPVTQFFVDMVNIFFKYNVEPPEILFKLCKAFIALSGINNFSKNMVDTEELLIDQITEFYINRTITDVNDCINIGLSILPDFIDNTLNEGIVKGLSKEVVNLNKLHDKIGLTINNCNEILNALKNKYSN